MKYLLPIICILSLYSFTFQKRDVYIFRNSAYYKNFYLKIDDKYVYSEKERDVSNGAYGAFIAKYSTSKDCIKIYLKINDKDTLFKYDLKKCNCDSLMMGYSELGFFSIMHEKEYPWYND